MGPMAMVTLLSDTQATDTLDTDPMATVLMVMGAQRSTLPNLLQLRVCQLATWTRLALPTFP